jgi:hypothetical protein
MTTIAKAILAINPKAQVSINAEDLDQITWHEGTTPIPKADIEVKMNEIANQPEQSNYAQQRRNAYPPIGDQLDMLWHTIDKDEKLQGKYFDFYQTLKTVKVKFPKK